MIKKIYLIFLISLLPLTSLAQAGKMVWSERMKLKGTLFAIGEMDGNMYLTRETRFKAYLEKFQLDNMAPLSSTKLDLSAPDPETRKLKLQGRLIIDGKMILFGSGYNSQHKMAVLYAITINSRGEIETGWKELARIETDKWYNIGVFGIRLSADTNKILITMWPLYKKDENYKQKIDLVVLDKDLNQLWSKKFELPFSDRQTRLLEFLLDKKGHAHIYANVTRFSRKEMKESGKENQDPKIKYILSFNPETGEVKEYEIVLHEKIIKQIALSQDVNGDIILAGFYKDNKDGKAPMSGFFHVRIPANTNEKEEVSIEKFKEQVSSNYVVRHLIPRKDGSMVMISQDEEVITVCSMNAKSGESSCHDTYYFNDILITGISAEGEIVWKKNIQKRSHSPLPDFLSYGIFTSDTSIHIIFNDLKSNYGADGTRVNNESLFNIKKSLLVEATIALNGGVSTTILVDDNKKDEAYIMPATFLRVTGQTLFMMAGPGRKGIKFGTLHLGG